MDKEGKPYIDDVSILSLNDAILGMCMGIGDPVDNSIGIEIL